MGGTPAFLTEGSQQASRDGGKKTREVKGLREGGKGEREEREGRET